MRSQKNTARALARFALVTAAAVAAASLWAGNRPEQGLLLDAQTWNEEVATASTGPWPEDGWYRLVPQEKGVEVRAVKPADAATIAADALFLRGSYRHLEVLRQIRLDRDHELTLGPVRFSLRVEEVDAGVQYAIGYGGQTYTYLLGPQGAQTSVLAIADVDGDRRPDFLVEVEDQATFLLLSTHAQPGANLPTAELPAHGC